MRAHGRPIGTPVVRRVEDVYRQGIRTVATGDRIVASQMIDLQVRHLAVVEGGEVVGMISARDVLELAAVKDDEVG